LSKIDEERICLLIENPLFIRPRVRVCKESAPVGCGVRFSPHRGDKALPPEGAGPGVVPWSCSVT
jgi:hypothetical protein